MVISNAPSLDGMRVMLLMPGSKASRSSAAKLTARGV